MFRKTFIFLRQIPIIDKRIVTEIQKDNHRVLSHIHGKMKTSMLRNDPDHVNKLFENFIKNKVPPTRETISLLLDANINNIEMFRNILKLVDMCKIKPTRNIISVVVTTIIRQNGWEEGWNQCTSYLNTYPELVSTKMIGKFIQFFGGTRKNLPEAEKIFNDNKGISATNLIKSLGRVYFDTGNFQLAEDLIIRAKTKKSTKLFNCLILKATSYKRMDIAERLLALLKTRNGVPDRYTFSILMNAYLADEKYERAIELFEECNMQPDAPLLTTALRCFTKSDMVRAEEVFERLIQCGAIPQVIYLNWLFEGYIEKNQLTEASMIPLRINEMGMDPDRYTYYYMMVLAIKQKELERATQYCDMISPPIFIAHNALILFLIEQGKTSLALKYYHSITESGLVVESEFLTVKLMSHLYTPQHILEAEKISRDRFSQTGKMFSFYQNLVGCLKYYATRDDIVNAERLFDEIMAAKLPLCSYPFVYLIYMYDRKGITEKKYKMYTLATSINPPLRKMDRFHSLLTKAFADDESMLEKIKKNSPKQSVTPELLIKTTI